MSNLRLTVLLSLMMAASWLLLSESVLGGSLAEQFDEIFGKATSTKTVRLDGLFSCQTINDKLVAVFGQGENRELRVCGADLEKELWSVKFPFTFYNLSEGIHPAILLNQVLDEAAMNIKAYDIDGQFLFAKDTFGLGEVFASPNGQYFYSNYSQTDRNYFIVFNRNGDQLISFLDSAQHNLWYASAFNDSVAAYFVDQEVRFIHIPSGGVISTIKVPVGQSEDPIYPCVRIANNGNQMVICWHNRILYVTPKMGIGWEKEYGQSCLNSAFSKDNQFVALYQGGRKEAKLIFLRAVTGDILWTQNFQVSSTVGTSRHKDLSFGDGYVRILSPQTRYLVRGEIDEKTKSYIFAFDRKIGTLTNKSIFDGVTFFLENDIAEMVISIGWNDKTTLMVKEWKNEK